METLSPEPEIAFEPGNERIQYNKGHRGLCDDNRKSSSKRREWRWRMCAKENWGGKGCRGRGGKKVTESWKSLLFQEMAQIGREQTRERGRWPFPSLMLQQPWAASPTGRSVPSPSCPSLSPLSLQDKLALSGPFPTPRDPGSRARCAQRRAGRVLDTRGKRRKGRCDFFTRTYQFSFNHSQRNKNGCLKHFQIPFSYQGENAHRNYTEKHRII